MSKVGRARKRQVATVLLVAAIVAASFLFYTLSQGSGSPTGTFHSFSFTPPPLNNRTGFASSLVFLSAANLNSSTTLLAGETLDIELNSSAGSTGYDWNVSTSSGIAYQNYTVVATSSVTGGPQTRDYAFQALQLGNQTILLQYEQQFAPHQVQATIDIQIDVLPTPLLLSYSFDVGSSGGSLAVVLKNDQSSNFTFNQVYLDETQFTGQALNLGAGCGDFVPGAQCSFTLTFGASQSNLVNGTSHWLELVSPIADEFAYQVTVGAQYEAPCAVTSSC